MKAFVTGGTGFVGSHLIDRLLAKNVEVFALKRKTSDTKWLDAKKINYVEGDLFSDNILKDTIKNVDYVFHVAGVIKAKNYTDYERGNNIATKNLVEISHEVNPNLKKFVHISSLAVCGPAPDKEPITEEYTPKPITSYGETKLKAEQELHKFRDKLNYTIIRPPAVFGPRDKEILIYFKTYNNGLNSIIGFKEKFLSLVYIDELIDGIILAAESDASNGQTYFICMDDAFNWDQIGAVTGELLNKKAIKIRLPHSLVFSVGYISQFFANFTKQAATLNVEKCKDITQPRWICSNEKAKRELGFRQKLTLKESFKETIDWYKKEGWIKSK
ncbi:MAG: NAD-dependent epimerase/dehydratase family protein [Ignavibacteriaceae bacterium]|jgi:nucleoside-diphosphate-sugar epimerase|nr:MAG: nucleoside-diphosphate sugar epimerase [Chlorobi bacterium OLB4]MBW7856389.1 NAD-dependent epimerase/dehydratase family protein [Ignavibacteria bacterium]MEB2329480.1 NAD-dependent epimerase/dehydratase family protein [Ignavibacteriaceae bacterium]OQY78987.1 MAG: hypothetical protein B6D43_01280 [Ignavibacteriales bacterium UTCHB1]